jgi:phage terminase large subunit-like protein
MRVDSKGRTVRRYRRVLLYIPRKTGKTPLAAGMADAIFFIDQERGKQIFCAAADTFQASLLFRHARGMVEQEPALLKQVNIYETFRSMVLLDDPASVFKVLSADAHTKHGLNPTAFFIDELHTQPNPELVHTLQTSMASANRPQPLEVYLTTADYDRPSVCNKIYTQGCKIRDGRVKDSTFLPVIYEASPEDDWTDPAIWAKANPNLGVSVSREYMERACQEAQDFPTEENKFKRLHLNIVTGQDVRWLPMEAWDKCGSPVDARAMGGRPCFAGLDLSATVDITALVLVWPPEEEGGIWSVLPYFWIPADHARKRERRDRVPYETWARQGWIEMTPGDVVDYDMVRKRINELADEFGFKKIGNDPWNAKHMEKMLTDDGFDVIPMRQGHQTMGDPSKELEKLVVGGQLAHSGNEVLTWMAGNVTVRMDSNANIMPDKKKSTEKIDGIVALIMAIGVAIEFGDEGGPSVYETRGLLTL